MPRSFAAAVLMLAVFLVAAPAGAQPAPTDEQLGKPCKSDLERLCPGVKPGGGRGRDCLLSKADQVSAQCKARLEQAKEVHQACQGDARKFCRDIPPGRGRVAICLQEHEAELSQPCKAHLEQARARFKEVHQACRGDAQRFCADVPPGRGRVAVCLHEHQDALSEACRAQLVKPPTQPR